MSTLSMDSGAPAIQVKLRELWSSLLEVSVGDIAPSSGFLELGGNSMLLLGLQASIAHAFGVDLCPTELLGADTLSAMAAAVEAGARA